MLKAYYQLTKPGVMYGNLITTIAGFLFAAQGTIDWQLFIATTVGTALVISSACVINNYLDQDIDSIMDRTKSRPLITGEVSPRGALIFGIVLGVTGLGLLVLLTNWLVVGVGVLGWVVYVWLYGALSKRRSIHGTLVGSLSGAAPILAGYVAVSAAIDASAVILFLVLFFWQMPEFYSIAIFRREEYARASVPVITVVKGIPHTIKLIATYTVLLVASSLALSIFGIAGWTYFVAMLVFGLYFIQLSIEGLLSTQPVFWARKNFRFSLVYLLVFSALISVDWLLP